jgi:SAM-dependent methyltransferase
MSDFSKLRCPTCRGTLRVGAGLECGRCSTTYPILDGIPVMLPSGVSADSEQNLTVEKQFYEDMFSGLKGVHDGHCISYGHERIYEFVNQVERGTVLEAGCGGGHNGVAMAKSGFDVTAIDLTVNGVRAARALAEHEKQNIQYVCGDIKHLPFEDKAFDICFCSLVLHHFIAMDNLLKELSRVTKKCFIAFEVNGWDPVSFLRFNVINPTIGIASISKNQRVVFPERLTAALRENGFTHCVVQYEDMHDNIGKHPNSLKAKMIVMSQAVLGLFGKKFSSNKFLLRADR